MKQGKMNLWILLFVFSMAVLSLAADAQDDMQVINGLFQDNNYNLALQEIQRFRQTYPNHEILPVLQTVEGNIALHRQQYDLADSLFETIDTTKLDEKVQAALLLSTVQVKFYKENYNLSSTLASQYMQRYPSSEEYWQAVYWTARLDIKAQRYDKAIKSLLSIENRPEHNIIYSALVEAYAMNLQTVEAEKYLVLLIKDYPTSEYTNQAYLNQCQALYATGKYSTLLTYLNFKIPEKSIYYNDYLLLLGKSFFMQNDYAKSLNYLSLVLPENEESRFYKAMNYYHLNEDAKAKEAFTDLSVHAKSDLIRSNSFLQNQILVFESDQKAAIFNLDWYIQNNPKDPLLGAYNFQLGYSYYKQQKYSLAFMKLSKAITYRLDKITEDKAYYLIGDLYYLTDDKAAAEQSFLDYQKKMPNGLFIDEVLCKLGFINYDKKDMITAKSYFQQILDKYPDSAKWAISNFYLGEINYYNSNYLTAKKFYKESLKGNLDAGYIWLRISQSDYFIEDYTNALIDLEKIPEKKEFLLDKYLLKGNVYFNQNEYQKALEAYKIAEKNYQTKAEWEQVISQEALAYYLMKKFTEATAIYKQLSREASSPDKFLLLAANSAFSAQDYQQSSYLFNLYLKNHPITDNSDKALLGVADSHYNLGNYSQATLDYINILLSYDNGRLSDIAVKALGWSLKLAKEQDYSASLLNLEEKVKAPALKLKVKRIRLDYVQYKKEWSNTVQVADELIQTGNTDMKVQMIKADALANMKRFVEADSVFKKIQPEKLDTEAYLAWANIDIMLGDSLSALAKMKIASQKSMDPKIWIPLLTLLVQLNDADFSRTYTSFINSKPATGTEDAVLIWCEWSMKQQQYDNIRPKLATAIKSNDRLVRGKAEFLDAKLYFLVDNFQEAIAPLARIKYLYPDMTEYVLQSQYMLCISYIRTNDLETARTIFALIQPDLTAEQIAVIESSLTTDGGER